MKGSYLKFALMMSVSFVIMYAIMFLNAASWDHVMLSYTRTYMTLLMIAPMAVVMLAFMWGMYQNKALNVAVIVGSVAVFTLVLILLRTQTPIKDVAWMKAMIPHHSSAIMVSENATFEDPEAQKLAKEIIEAQKREIAEMKKMIDRLENAR
jgi:small-conductance mechanosensitive channel